MPKISPLVLMLLCFFIIVPVGARADEEKGAYETQVPPGMELKQVGKKASYRMIVPKGTTLRKEGDLRIIEGSGEYVSRKFIDYEARLDAMNAAIESLEKDVEEIKSSVADMRKAALTSREK